MNPSFDKLSIVVEGVGEIVTDRYATELLIQFEKAKKHNKILEVIFTDERSYWDHSETDDGVKAKRQAFIKHIKTWATYIDKSTKIGKARYEKLKTDIVLIATPESGLSEMS